MNISETLEFKKCDQIWKALGCPTPCHNPEYTAARAALASMMKKHGLYV